MSFFTEECDHNGEKTCVKDLEFRVPFEKIKLDLNIFTFDEMSQPMIKLLKT